MPSGKATLLDLVDGLVAGPLREDWAEHSVNDVQFDSRRIEPGDLFVAWSGEVGDGRDYAQQARERGAVAVICDQPRPDGFDESVPWIVEEAPRELLAALASRLHGEPQNELALVGVTGTNGKTTTTYLVQAMLNAQGRPAGVLGTLGYRFGALDLPASRTTPEGSDLIRTFAQMKTAGAQAAVMEVSSHALEQGRARGVRFDVCAFTNLTRDHFDFHQGFEDYFAAKRKLFDQVRSGGTAVINLADGYGKRLFEELEARSRDYALLSYGPGAHVRPLEVRYDETGIRGVIDTPGGKVAFESQLLGRYNLWNLECAIAIASALELTPDAMSEAIATFPPVKGRLERVDAGQDFPILIDYAHTDGGLRAALTSLRQLTPRKIVVVFGCGGGRDQGKRPLMGQAAGELADLPIATSDNPRNEDPFEILSQVEQGLKDSKNTNYRVIPDRRDAIKRAVALAAGRDDWCVLVAGKGHEEEQIIGNERLKFSDRAEIEAAVGEALGQATHG